MIVSHPTKAYLRWTNFGEETREIFVIKPKNLKKKKKFQFLLVMAAIQTKTLFKGAKTTN